MHLGNIPVKGEQSRTVFLKWNIPFRLKICCSFLHKKKEKKSFTPSPSSKTSADLQVYWLLQKATHHLLLLCPADQAPVTDYPVVPAHVQTLLIPSASTTACPMAPVCRLFRPPLPRGPPGSMILPSTPLCSHLPPLSSCSLCSGCSLHLPPAGFALATLPGWNVLSP